MCIFFHAIGLLRNLVGVKKGSEYKPTRSHLRCIYNLSGTKILKISSKFLNGDLLKEPIMLVVDVFSAPSLALKSFMFAQLYRAMVQTVGIVFF